MRALEIEPRDGHDHAARLDQRLMAGVHQLRRGRLGVLAHHRGAQLGRVGGLGTVPEPVDQAGEPAGRGRNEDREVARALLALVRRTRLTAVQR